MRIVMNCTHFLMADSCKHVATSEVLWIWNWAGVTKHHENANQSMAIASWQVKSSQRGLPFLVMTSFHAFFQIQDPISTFIIFYLDLPQFNKSKEAHCLSLSTEHWTRKNASRVAIHSIHQTRIENRANSKQTCSRNLLLPRQPNNISHVQNHRLKIIFSNLPSTNKWAWHEAVKTSQHWVEIGEERFKFQTNILGGLWSAHS